MKVTSNAKELRIWLRLLDLCLKEISNFELKIEEEKEDGQCSIK